MFRRLRIALILAMLALPNFLTAEECEARKTGVPGEALGYLEHGRTTTLPCAREAFQQIERLPQEEAIPILIKLLGYKRPLSDAEQSGIFFRGNGPTEMYPAIRSLFSFGDAAEPALIDFVAHDQNETGIERSNALHALLLIRHGAVVQLIETLHKRSVALSDTQEGAHLESATRDLIKRWCYAEIQPQCQNAIGQ